MTVECRPVPFSEVASFKEVAACGTAVVITSIKQIVKGDAVSSGGFPHLEAFALPAWARWRTCLRTQQYGASSDAFHSFTEGASGILWCGR